MSFNGRILTGRTLTGSISPAGEVDTFTASLISGLTYSVTAQGRDSGAGTLSDPWVMLYDADGTLLAANNDGAAGSHDAQMTFTMSNVASGDYTLAVDGNSKDATGSYRLTLSAGYASNAAERVNGTAQGDAVHGMAGADTLFGYEGNDSLYGDDGNDSLLGGNGNDPLNGGAGADRLRGQAGSDVLYGGAGADVLYGGTGADRFVFKLASDSDSLHGTDSIMAADGALAFEGVGVAGGDRIDLSAIDADVTHSGNQAFSFSNSGAAGTCYLTERGTSTVLVGSVNNDGIADFMLVIADGSIRAQNYTADEFTL